MPKEPKGFIYCFSNPSMPGIVKVGMTMRDPRIRLKEANATDTWKPPTPYTIDLVIKVKDPSTKETVLHRLLTNVTERINPKREFFRTSPDVIGDIMILMDGYLIDPDFEDIDYDSDDTSDNSSEKSSESENDEEKSETDEEESKTKNNNNETQIVHSEMDCLDMTMCFRDGQTIRHSICKDVWEGIYHNPENIIYCINDSKVYTSMTDMAKAHISYIYPNNYSFNHVVWLECEYQDDFGGEWRSCESLLRFINTISSTPK